MAVAAREDIQEGDADKQRMIPVPHLLRDDPRRLEDRMRMMRMTLAPALVWKRIKALAPKLPQ